MQESGLTEIIPLMCTSAMGPAFCAFSSGVPSGCATGEGEAAAVWGLEDCNILCLLIWQNFPGGSVEKNPPASIRDTDVILEWVAMPSSRASSQPRDRTQVSRIARYSLSTWEGYLLFLFFWEFYGYWLLSNVFSSFINVIVWFFS